MRLYGRLHSLLFVSTTTTHHHTNKVLFSPSFALALKSSSHLVCNMTSSVSTEETAPWTAGDAGHAAEAKEKLEVWPLDSLNAALLNEVHPRGYQSSEPRQEAYDLIAIGSGAGGLVSAKQVRVQNTKC